MSEVTLEAAEENLDEVLRFVEDALENTGCSLEDQRQIAIAVEEVFINIVSYAYKPGRGDTTLRLDVSQDPAEVTITFIDHGVPFDPLAKEDPDIDLRAKQLHHSMFFTLQKDIFAHEQYREYVHEGRDLPASSAEQFDQHKGNDAYGNTLGNAVKQRHRDDAEIRRHGIRQVFRAEGQLTDPSEHQETDHDQGGSRREGRDGCEKRREKAGQKKERACRDRGQSGAPSGRDARG